MSAYPIDSTVPPDEGEPPSNGATRIRALAAAVTTVLTVNHNVETDTYGEHSKITFHEPITSPVAVAESKGELYIKDVSAKAELHFMSEDEKELQITSLYGTVLKLLLDNSIISNATYLKAKDEAGTGTVDLIKAGRNVADDTDVVILSDKARLASNAAPTEDTDISNKKYVDDQIAAISVPILRYTEVVANNTDGTALAAETWTKVGLTNEEIDSETIGSLSSGVISLPAGTYEVHAVCGITFTAWGQARLRDTTNNTTLAVGNTVWSSDGISTPSIIDGYFTLADTANVELQALVSDAGYTFKAYNYDSNDSGDAEEQIITSSVFLRKVA